VREISHHYKTTVNGMVCHLKALRRKGRVTWQEGQARTIRVTGGDA
jgi:SOS-response transcriptional repressor LexA